MLLEIEVSEGKFTIINTDQMINATRYKKVEQDPEGKEGMHIVMSGLAIDMVGVGHPHLMIPDPYGERVREQLRRIARVDLLLYSPPGIDPPKTMTKEEATKLIDP